MAREKLRKIVVGTDFNELATAALAFASGIAARAEAELIVVYADAFGAPAEFTASQVRKLVESIERSRKSARQQLDHYVERHVPRGVKVSNVVVDGPPAASIIKVAKEQDAGLIVLGTHGRGGLERLMIGSVAESVIRDAPTPVLTIRSAAPRSWIRRVLCPVNDSDLSAVAVEHAARISAAVGAELTIMQLVKAGEGAFDAETLRPADVRTTIIRQPVEHAAAEILAIEEGGDYDLLVVGAEHKFIHDVTIFGDTTASVTRHARTPVLTVTRNAARPHEPASAGEAAHVV